jgi:PHS family inorganic phosphate transporter-like MFS transporter
LRNGISNAAVQYNYTSIAVAVLLWSKIYGTVPAWSSSLLTSTVFLGSITGMLVLGYAGDAIGRESAMSISLSMMLSGALASALLSWGGLQSTAILVAIWRFIMGIGIGGVYPLSAASSYEEVGPLSSLSRPPHEEDIARRRRVAW